jgi:putative hemolysin
MNRLRLRHLVRRKVPGADILNKYRQDPDALFGVTLVGLNIASTVIPVLTASLALSIGGERAIWLSGVLTTLVLLIFCEYFPKAWFQSSPANRCLPFARLLDFLAICLKPISVPLMAIVRILVPISEQDAKAQPFVTREEITHLAMEGQTSGILTNEEHKMIHEVIQLKTRLCREIMIPKDKMHWVDSTMPISSLLEFARTKHVDRFPVFDSSKNNFTGILSIFDVLADKDNASKSAKDYIRPLQLVMDYTPVDHVLPRMRVTRQPLVLVTNERYAVIGLVTLNDVLDEVVGNL